MRHKFSKWVFGLILFVFGGCVFGGEYIPDDADGFLRLPSGERVVIELALTPEQQAQGLSGVMPEDFGENEGMLFMYDHDAPKSFWMPDTYFDLDIFFLDADFRVLDIERDMPHHPGRDEPPAIARTRLIKARHVLEMKSSSGLAERIEIGDQLEWEEV